MVNNKRSQSNKSLSTDKLNRNYGKKILDKNISKKKLIKIK